MDKFIGLERYAGLKKAEDKGKGRAIKSSGIEEIPEEETQAQAMDALSIKYKQLEETQKALDAQIAALKAKGF